MDANGIGDEGALELCSALDPISRDMHQQKTNAYLTELSLRGNLISDKAAIEVKRRVGLRMDVELQQRFCLACVVLDLVSIAISSDVSGLSEANQLYKGAFHHVCTTIKSALPSLTRLGS